MYFMPPPQGAATEEEVDSLGKLKEERRQQELQARKAAANVRSSKALQGAWAKTWTKSTHAS